MIEWNLNNPVQKIVFIAGLILLAVGFFTAIMAPADVGWEPRSRILVEGETLSVSAGWKTGSEKLAEEVLRVETPLKYEACWGATPPFFGEERGFVIIVNAVEQSSPQKPFNFYVFDRVNFDLWKAGLSYKAYFEEKGKTSVSINFSIALKENLPDAIYFVVEEHEPGVEPTVLVNSTISWIERSSRTDCTGYVASTPQVLIEEAKDFRLRGNATEMNGNRFNFYIMEYSNYWDWLAGKNYTVILKRENVNSLSFNISLTEDQVGSAFSVCFVVENPLKDVDEKITIHAALEWQEKTTVSTIFGGKIIGSIMASIGLVMTIAGIALLVFKPRQKKYLPADSMGNTWVISQ
ncbi:MAG: hypothetical protein FGF53_05630 [Candidatus Brockarchaeota archaeon]|nr:hypothetical protein [Candidatus Brockarchaeota archaeon]MBO3808538.1 hypothetical protein [Candidatus Brockarchaeota archaeon]